MSRFLLNLQEAKHESQHFDADRSILLSQTSSSGSTKVTASVGVTLAANTDIVIAESNLPDNMKPKPMGAE